VSAGRLQLSLLTMTDANIFIIRSLAAHVINARILGANCKLVLSADVAATVTGSPARLSRVNGAERCSAGKAIMRYFQNGLTRSVLNRTG